MSGLKLNNSKSVVLKLGTLRNKILSLSDSESFIWTSEKAKTLGIHFHFDSRKSFELNLEPKIEAFKNCLKQWQHRKLTLMGKVTVVKTFALPKLVYPLSVLPNPTETVIKDLNKYIFNFIWDNKPDKIKRDVLKIDFDKGGLKLTDIESFICSLKASWVKRIISENNNAMWKSFYDDILKKAGGNLIFESNLDKKQVHALCHSNLFLRDILLSWVEMNELFNKKYKIDNSNIIWNNKNITFNGKAIFWEDWWAKGIKILEHIYDFRTKTYYTFAEMKRIYNFNEIDMFRFNTLRNAIPKEMKDKISIENITEERKTPLKEKINTMNKVNQYLYLFVFHFHQTKQVNQCLLFY